MNTEQVLRISLLIEAVFVLVGYLFHYDVWISVVCYWASTAILHLNDILDRK